MIIKVVYLGKKTASIGSGMNITQIFIIILFFPYSEITESEFKRKTNLTRSLNLKYQSAVHRHKNWKKLKVQTNSKEVKNSYELDSIGSATPSVKTTYTEELFV